MRKETLGTDESFLDATAFVANGLVCTFYQSFFHKFIFEYSVALSRWKSI